MTKRFFIDVEDITQENAVFEDGNCYCFEDDSEALVERLNQYADENEQLKKELQSQSKRCTESIQKIKEENEQLKQELSDFKQQVYGFEDIADLKNWQQKYEEGDVE